MISIAYVDLNSLTVSYRDWESTPDSWAGEG